MTEVDGSESMMEVAKANASMAKAYERRWNGALSYVEDDHVCVVRSSKDVEQRIGNMGLAIFELRIGVWERANLTLSQRWYAEARGLIRLPNRRPAVHLVGHL